MINNIDYFNYSATTTGAVESLDQYKELVVAFGNSGQPIIVKNTLGFTPTFRNEDYGTWEINYDNASIATDTQKFFSANCALDASNNFRVASINANYYGHNDALFACAIMENSDDNPGLYGEPPVSPAPNNYDYLDFRYYDGTVATATSQHTAGVYFIPFFDFLMVLGAFCFTVLMTWFVYRLLYDRRK